MLDRSLLLQVNLAVVETIAAVRSLAAESSFLTKSSTRERFIFLLIMNPGYSSIFNNNIVLPLSNKFVMA